jgi:hypothetical protein
MLGWIPFRASSLGQAFGMWAKLFDPGAYLHLGLRENTYLATALLLLGFLLVHALQRRVRPWLEERPIPWALVETAGLAAIAALVFAFLRPINQFIYFQF